MSTQEGDPTSPKSPLEQARDETIAKFQERYPDADVTGMVDEFIEQLKASGLIARHALPPEERLGWEDVDRDHPQQYDHLVEE